MAQVSTDVLGVAIVAVGGVVFCVIVILVVAVHPFNPMTVAVYVPGIVTFKRAFEPTFVVPLDQTYEAPPVAVTPMLVVVHVKTVEFGAVIAADGVRIS